MLPLAYMRDVRELAQKHGLRSHIDGARLFNAAVALALKDGGDPVQRAREICEGYDSVSVCLSKGLGAPVGSLLLGSAAFIAEARRTRKMLGGGMRQAGLLAAAGIHALQHHVARLADDHANAAYLAEQLSAIAARHTKLAGNSAVLPAQTNIVFMDVAEDVAGDFMRYLAQQNVRVTSGTQRVKERAIRRIRWVTHLDLDRSDVERALQIAADF